MACVSKETVLEAVSRLYQEFMKFPFPSGLAGADRAGFDLVMLDSDTAGWVFVWIKNGGKLEARGRTGLRWCRLREMARLAAGAA